MSFVCWLFRIFPVLCQSATGLRPCMSAAVICHLAFAFVTIIFLLKIQCSPICQTQCSKSPCFFYFKKFYVSEFARAHFEIFDKNAISNYKFGISTQSYNALQCYILHDSSSFCIASAFNNCVEYCVIKDSESLYG